MLLVRMRMGVLLLLLLLLLVRPYCHAEDAD